MRILLLSVKVQYQVTKFANHKRITLTVNNISKRSQCQTVKL